MGEVDVASLAAGAGEGQSPAGDAVTFLDAAEGLPDCCALPTELMANGAIADEVPGAGDHPVRCHTRQPGRGHRVFGPAQLPAHRGEASSADQVAAVAETVTLKVGGRSRPWPA